jgi:hypothetical protein
MTTFASNKSNSYTAKTISLEDKLSFLKKELAGSLKGDYSSEESLFTLVRGFRKEYLDCHVENRSYSVSTQGYPLLIRTDATGRGSQGREVSSRHAPLRTRCGTDTGFTRSGAKLRTRPLLRTQPLIYRVSKPTSKSSILH